mgnify:CR=1 FL=1
MFVGCRAGSVTTERWRHPAPGKAKVIHLDVDPAVPGANYPARCGAGRATPSSRLSNVKSSARGQRNGRSTLRRIESRKRTKVRQIPSARRVRRQTDQTGTRGRGTSRVARSRCHRGRRRRHALSVFFSLLSGARHGPAVFSNRAHGALGYSMAAAMGAHFARPKSKCVSVMGDGSFGFTCGELETAARYQLPITFIVISNASYGWIKAGQKSGYGQRYFAVDFAATDHAAVAAAFGVKSWRVTEPE